MGDLGTKYFESSLCERKDLTRANQRLPEAEKGNLGSPPLTPLQVWWLQKWLNFSFNIIECPDDVGVAVEIEFMIWFQLWKF